MTIIATRFPPSPSGYLHVGGARTALFNWLYARHTQGRFVFRIEDTDVARSSQESVDAIIESLEWLGIDWNEGPYFQSQRLEIYKEYLGNLIDAGAAYYCTCTPDEVEKMREEAIAKGLRPRYNGKCRDLKKPASEESVIRLKAPQTGTTVLCDLVKGDIVFQNEELDDFVIARTGGMPTYHLVVVVDDIAMGINTIIRGDDHVMNTPKQMLIYHALNESLPTYAHVPMVLGNDKTRLSKRHGAMSVTAYRDMGILPEAMINYLVRLGWSYGDQEFFTVSELIEKFTLDNIGRSPGVFDVDKLLSLNAAHIKMLSDEELANRLRPFLEGIGIACPAMAYLTKVVRTLKERCKTLVEMAENSLFYFTEKISYDPDAIAKIFSQEAMLPLEILLSKLKKTSDLSSEKIEMLFKETAEETNLKMKQIASPVQVALTGKTKSPGLTEIILALGQEETMRRLEQAVAYIKENGV